MTITWGNYSPLTLGELLRCSERYSASGNARRRQILTVDLEARTASYGALLTSTRHRRPRPSEPVIEID